MNKSLLASLLLAAGMLPAFAVSPAVPRPVYLPNTPPADKAIADYTPLDVLGAILTDSDPLPKNHPFMKATVLADIKANWPGAKIATSVDAMLMVVINAPADANGNHKRDVVENIRFILKNVMDLTDTQKADAFVRVVDAQTDPKKKAFAEIIAVSMFETFLDPRFLLYIKSDLDNATVVRGPAMAEGVPNEYSIRSDAAENLEGRLTDIGLPPDPAWEQLDEAAHCAALKQWMTDNWTLIGQKCAETKAKPDWKAPEPGIIPFDARW